MKNHLERNQMTELDGWIADRTRNFDSSGIRRMFDLAAKLKDPINLSITLLAVLINVRRHVIV